MTAKTTYFALLGAIVLLLAGIVGSAYEFDGLLHKQAVKLANVKLEYQQLNSQEKGLKKDKQDIATYGSLSSITKQIVPQDKNQAEAIREIINIAANSSVTPHDGGVKLTSISFPASTLGSTVVKAPGASASPPAGATAPSAAATSKPALSQLATVPNIPGVYKLEITVQNDSRTEITYPMFYKFLSGLETNRRTAEVSNISITPDSQNRAFIMFSLTLDTYIKP